MSITPHYDRYPKDPSDNLKWRRRCGHRALTDARFRHSLWDACMEDVLFFMAAVCWSFEPRAKEKVRPFVPWEHQEEVFVAMDKAIDESEREEKCLDVLVDKSRAQGGTFGYLWIDLRRWLRDSMFSAGYVTRNEMLVDSATDADTLFWKLAWGIERLPEWMRPAGFEIKKHRSLSAHSLLNPANGATLVGYAAGQDVAAGGRKTVFTADEFGAKDFIAGGKDESVMEALHDVSNCLEGHVPVLTDYGPVPIEKVEWFHRIWDGTMWVSHGGCVCQGERETISAYGVRLTPDHLVLTTKGWMYAGVKGYQREDVWLPDGYWERWIDPLRQTEMAVPMPVRQSRDGVGKQPATGAHEELRVFARDTSREVTDCNVSCVDCDEAKVLQSTSQVLPPLRRSWCPSVPPLGKLRDVSGGHGRAAQAFDYRSFQHQRKLRAAELSMGHAKTSGQQQADESRGGDISGPIDSGAGCQDGRHCVLNNSVPPPARVDRGRTISPGKPKTEAVYDLLNCGPRQAFTVLDDNGLPLLVHNCLRLVSARYADAGVFHEACEDPDHSGLHLILDWKDNPIHAKHSYVVRDGRPEARKPDEQGVVNDYHAEHPDLQKRLERKGYKYENVVRSPWYDMRCLRPTATPRLIASQLDRNPRGAVGKVFPTDLLDRVKRETCKLPVWQGTPVFDGETLALKGLIKRDDGPLKLWFQPGPDYSCPLGPFTLGCDVAVGSSGVYSSNSVASGIDDRTGEQVVEYTVRGMPMIKFARNVVGLALWLRKALVGWEDAGIVSSFAKEIMEVLYYGNVYYRPVSEVGSQKKTKKAGWWNGRDGDKADLFEKMALGMETKRYTPRSADLVRECGEYEWEKGKIIHQPTKNRGATEKAHGDRCIAAGVAWLVYSEGLDGFDLDTGGDIGETPEYGSFLWCEQRERSRVDSDSPEFGLLDVVNA